MSLLPIAAPVPGEGLPYVPTPRFFAQAPTQVDFLSADTDTIVPHPLGRVPLGYLVVGLSANMVVYSGSVDSNERNVTLRASAAGTAWVLFL